MFENPREAEGFARVCRVCYSTFSSHMIERPQSSSPIPSHAKKVFSGILFDVYQWDQEMFDGTTAVFEKLVRNDSVTLIAVTVDKKIILQHEEQPGRESFTALPGGGTDEGEDPTDAAKRELLEESGYVPESIELWYMNSLYTKIDYIDFMFIARGCKKVADPELDSGEKIIVEELTFDNFCERVMDDSFRNKDISLRVAKMILQGKKEELRNFLLGS